MKINVSIFIIFAVLSAILPGIPPAADAQDNQERTASFSGTGTVMSVDDTRQVITIRIGHASRFLKDKIGKDLTFSLSSNAFIGCGIGWAACPLLHPDAMEETSPRDRMGLGRGVRPLREVRLSDIDVNDQVHFMGNLTSDRKGYTIDQLMVWTSGEEPSSPAAL